MISTICHLSAEGTRPVQPGEEEALRGPSSTPLELIKKMELRSSQWCMAGE